MRTRPARRLAAGTVLALTVALAPVSADAAVLPDGEPAAEPVDGGWDAAERAATVDPVEAAAIRDALAARERALGAPGGPGRAVEAPGLVAQLPVVQRPQETNYWCGPASAVQALLAIPGAERSAHDGQQLSQQALAGDAYLATDAVGWTSWPRRSLVRGLNRWLTGTTSGPYRYVDAPSGDVFLGAIASSVETGRPALVNTVEEPSTGRYNNHPDSGATIAHVVTVRGWDAATGQVQFVDPWSSAWFDASRGTSVRPMFWQDGAAFAQTFLTRRGVVF